MPSANCFASPARERQPRLTEVVRIRPRKRDRPTGRAAPAEIVDIASSHRQSGLLLPPGGISSRMSSLLLLATRASPWRRPRTPVGNRCTVTAPWRRVQPFVAALPDGAVPPLAAEVLDALTRPPGQSAPGRRSQRDRSPGHRYRGLWASPAKHLPEVVLYDQDLPPRSGSLPRYHPDSHTVGGPLSPTGGLYLVRAVPVNVQDGAIAPARPPQLRPRPGNTGRAPGSSRAALPRLSQRLGR